MLKSYNDDTSCAKIHPGLKSIFIGEWAALDSITVNATDSNVIDTITLGISANPLVKLVPNQDGSSFNQEQTRQNTKRVDIARTVAGQFLGINKDIPAVLDALNADCSGFFAVVLTNATDSATGEPFKFVLGLDITDPVASAFKQAFSRLQTADGGISIPDRSDDTGPVANFTLSDTSELYAPLCAMTESALDLLT